MMRSYEVQYGDGKRNWHQEFNDFQEALAYFIKRDRDIMYDFVKLIGNREEGNEEKAD